MKGVHAIMKKTQKYGLNQWEMTDRVLMKDFNADNAKLESALSSLASKDSSLSSAISAETRRATEALAAEAKRADDTMAAHVEDRLAVVTLADVTVTASGDSMVLDIPVDGPALGNLLMFSVEIIPTGNYVTYFILESERESSSAGGGFIVCRNPSTHYPIFFPLRDPNSRALALSGHPASTYAAHVAGRAYKNITRFGLWSESGEPTGSYRMIIRGVR